MIAAHKVQSENEEACDKVRAAVTTDPVEGNTELGQQIAKLMPALTRTGQGNSPASAPNIPRQRGHGRGQMNRSTPGHHSSHNEQTGLGQTASVHSTSAGHGTETTTSRDRIAKRLKIDRKVQKTRGTPALSSDLGVKVWAIWLRNAPPQPKLSTSLGGTEGMWPNPHQCQLQQSTVGPQCSLPDPKPKLTTMKAALRMGWPEVAPVPFLNPDPIAHLVRCSNEAPGIVDGQRMTALVDSGAQVSSISSQFCEDLALQTQPLGQLLALEGTGGSAIPYLGLNEVNLQIPRMKNYNENVMLQVIPTMTYSEMVLVMVGSKIIDRAMRIITKGELTKVTTT